SASPPMNALVRVLTLSTSFVVLSFGSLGLAQPAAAGGPAASSAPSVVDSKNSESCVERIPSGKDRPHFTEKIAHRAVSGHALTLEVVVEHGKGETVLPTGFRL